MRKLFILMLLFGIGSYSICQDNYVLKSTKAPKQELLPEHAPKKQTNSLSADIPSEKSGMINNSATTFIPIGNSGNAYGFYSNPRTYLWADPVLNSIVFTHRMTGGTEIEGNSRLAYDMSIDGGNNWTTNVQVYTPTGAGSQYPYAAGRYPQGAILNPEGNTDPVNAYYTYFAPTIIDFNGIWGGYTYGSNPLTVTDPPTPSQVNLEYEDGYYRLIPDAFTITQQGIAWYLEPSSDYRSGTVEYTGELIIGKGEIIDGEIAYEESLLEFMDPLDAINDSKIAWAPDGQTGYILIMSDTESDPQPFTSYHPILLKTTDGGENWGDPIHVLLGGIDGIENIKYYWSDETIESIDYYGTGFDRDEVYYNMGYQVDLIVDGQGNPHITGIIAIGTDSGWYPVDGVMATWHVFSNDGGISWDAVAFYDNLFLDGEIGGLTMYNRPYAASTYDGEFLVFSWIDTDLEGAEANTNPNIYTIAYHPETNLYTEVMNVTSLTSYWYSAFYGSMSQYVFMNEYYLEVPFVFTEYTSAGDPDQEMNFYYINGFHIIISDGIIDNNNSLFAVSQNSPNPAKGITKITVTSEVRSPIEISVTNILGQTVYTKTENSSALVHTFNIDVNNFEPGIYFYTVKISNKTISKKMIVE